MRKVAIVEDVTDNLEFLDYVLRDRYEVIRCESGEDALVKIACNPPDLVLMDISLPRMDGIEVLSRIRADASLRLIPIIAVTAHAMMGDREKYLKAGFNDYISKPIVDVDAFLGTVARLLPDSAE
jgi:CheY-like chemotaxis protein